MAFEPNCSGALPTLNIDNAEGVGHVGIDHFKLITISGSAPYVYIHIPVVTANNGIHNPSRINKDRNAPDATIVPQASSAATCVSPAVIIGPIVGVLPLLTSLWIVLRWRTSRYSRKQRDFEALSTPSFNPDSMVRPN